ncbi:HNH endonuclease [Humidesulfovibrio idahonensis]
MAIKLKTRVMLWGRSGNLCAYCRKPLEEPTLDGEDVSLAGEACHIVADSVDGPRGKSELTKEERDKYINLILLCNTHHKLVDDFPEKYTVDFLNNMKSSHETWVKTTLGYDQKAQKDKEYYTMIIDKWEELCHISEWDNVTGNFFYGAAHIIHERVFDDIRAFCMWLRRRHWPKSNKKIENAFSEFSYISKDLLNMFSLHMEERGEGVFYYDKFYKIKEWNVPLYDQLAEKYDYNIALLYDLFFELTRAGNLIVSIIRDNILPDYRTVEGRLALVLGDVMSHNELVLEYTEEELKSEKQYNGISQFKIDRATRSDHYGEEPKGSASSYS